MIDARIFVTVCYKLMTNITCVKILFLLVGSINVSENFPSEISCFCGLYFHQINDFKVETDIFFIFLCISCIFLSVDIQL